MINEQSSKSSSGRVELANRLMRLLDHTALDDEKSRVTAMRTCDEAMDAGVAAVCIWPEFVAEAKKKFESGRSDVRIATVANFPKGTDSPDAVIQEIAAAITAGADEIDVVIPHEQFRNGDPKSTKTLLTKCAEACRDKLLLKVIIEVEKLGNSDLIADASLLAIECGAQFVKTSTGKSGIKWSTEDKLNAVATILGVIGKKKRLSGINAGVKISGGVGTLEEATRFLYLSEALIGIGWPASSNFRIGSSGLLLALKESITSDNAIR